MPKDSEAYRPSQVVDENSGTYRVGELYAAVYDAMTVGKTNTTNLGPLAEGAGTANAVTGGVSQSQTDTKIDTRPATTSHEFALPNLPNITPVDIRTHELLAALCQLSANRFILPFKAFV